MMFNRRYTIGGKALISIYICIIPYINHLYNLYKQRGTSLAGIDNVFLYNDDKMIIFLTDLSMISI